ncbi:hypothetical protein LSAT2_033102, partial [Lamellibrachia satsuma]
MLRPTLCVAGLLLLVIYIDDVVGRRAFQNVDNVNLVDSERSAHDGLANDVLIRRKRELTKRRASRVNQCGGCSGTPGVSPQPERPCMVRGRICVKLPKFNELITNGWQGVKKWCRWLDFFSKARKIYRKAVRTIGAAYRTWKKALKTWQLAKKTLEYAKRLKARKAYNMAKKTWESAKATWKAAKETWRLAKETAKEAKKLCDKSARRRWNNNKKTLKIWRRRCLGNAAATALLPGCCEPYELDIKEDGQFECEPNAATSSLTTSTEPTSTTKPTTTTTEPTSTT